MPNNFKKLINSEILPVSTSDFSKHRQEVYDTIASIFDLQGSATLSGGTVVVVNKLCTSNSTIIGNAQDANSSGIISFVPASGSFTINSSVGADHGRIGWFLYP